MTSIWLLIFVLHFDGMTLVKQTGYDTLSECLYNQSAGLELLSKTEITGTSYCRPFYTL